MYEKDEELVEAIDRDMIIWQKQFNKDLSQVPKEWLFEGIQMSEMHASQYENQGQGLLFGLNQIKNVPAQHLKLLYKVFLGSANNRANIMETIFRVQSNAGLNKGDLKIDNDEEEPSGEYFQWNERWRLDVRDILDEF